MCRVKHRRRTRLRSISFRPLGSILQAKKKTPALRGAAFLARTKAVYAPSLQPTKAAFSSCKWSITARTSNAINSYVYGRSSRTAAMAAAIDEHGPIAGARQGRNLITPITAAAETTMQHDHGRAGPKCRLPVRWTPKTRQLAKVEPCP